MFAYSDKNPIVIIDTAHGGSDPGMIGKHFKEKDISLLYSMYMLKRMIELKIPCAITRTTDKSISPLDRSLMVKNSGAKLCLSNHINAASSNVRGCEVIHSIHNDGKIAKEIYNELITVIPGRRVFSRANNSGSDYYFMHRLTGSVTTLILEYGFGTNEEDSKLIMNNMVELVEAVLRGVCQSLGYFYLKPDKGGSMGNTDTSDKVLDGALDVLIREGLLSTKDYWTANAIKGKSCDGVYVKTLILNVAERLGYKIPADKSYIPYEVVGTTHIARVDPMQLDISMQNTSIENTPFENGVNGTFFWYTDSTRKQTYPNGILIKDGVIIQNAATHAEKSDRSCPQSVLIIYKDGKVEIKRIKYASIELKDTLSSIRLAIGGLGLISRYKYSPATEGFYTPFADVLRSTVKTFIGYKKSENLIYIMIRPDSTHDRIIQSCQNLGLDLAISLDGGGSSSLKIDKAIKVPGDGRKINNYLIW